MNTLLLAVFDQAPSVLTSVARSVGSVFAYSAIIVGALWLLIELRVNSERKRYVNTETGELISSTSPFFLFKMFLANTPLNPNFSPYEEHIQRAEQHGRAYLTWRGLSSSIVVHEPEDVKRVLSEKDTLHRRPFPAAINSIFGNSIIAVAGDEWKVQRKTCDPAFKYKKIKSLLPVFVQVGTRLTGKWEEELKGKKSAEIEVQSWINKMTLDAIGLGGFSYDFNALNGNEETNRQLKNYEIIMNSMLSITGILLPFLQRLPTASNRRLAAAQQEFDTMFYKIIEQHRAQNELKEKAKKEGEENPEAEDGDADLLDHILSLDPKGSLSDTVIRDNMFLFFLAGHDTSASALTSALHLLSINPDIQERVYEEARSAITDPANITYETVQMLKLATNVIKETLRMCPPVNTTSGRITTAPTAIGGFNLPEGVLVSPNIIAMNYNPKLWPEPRRFNPDRFSTVNKKIDPLQLLTFSAGPRICLGMKFAMMEMTVTLALMVRAFQFAPKQGWVWLHRTFSLTNGPEGGLPLQVTRRT
eukprot:TRINITY_DN9813_c0_g1_i2.p1 TRINITY_DN9813_c0_g1~~TRINITY_DN9813_c0_g1_i2.p1  ORF type:complete len:570 (-),score=94.80 TRINITY_DN9813_c0_g1_i2:15-1610(-)